MNEDEFYDEAGHLLRVEMVRARLNQAKLAERAGMSLNTVNRHMNGKPMPLIAILRYAEALDVPIHRLIPSNQSTDCDPELAGVA